MDFLFSIIIIISRSTLPVQCYICFDDEDTLENPLTAPCRCKGGTRYVHLKCLQRWQCSAAEDKVCVVSTAEEKNVCKVCKSRYKTHVKVKDGRILPLMVHQLPPPFICFLVVTRHETAEELFNTQFQVSFAESKQIMIGRSRQCDMVRANCGVDVHMLLTVGVNSMHTNISTNS